MALTLEDILLQRQGRTKGTGLTYTPPASQQQDDAERDFLQNFNETYAPPAPVQGPPEPSTLSRITSGITSAGSAILGGMGQQYLQEAETGRATPPGLIGAGEAATSLGTGLVGGAVGVMGAAEEAIRNPPYPRPDLLFREPYNPPPVDPNYWTNLTKKAKDISAEFTYQPRTPEGKAIAGVANVPFEVVHEFSQRAMDSWVANKLFTEDQKQAVGYVHELLTMIAMGEIGGAAKGFIGRKLIGDYQKAFVGAESEPQGGPNTENLKATTEAIQARVESLREKQTTQGIKGLDEWLAQSEQARVTGRDPTLMPRLREEGQSVLDRLNENPDNIEYQNAAVSFFEKTRGSGDTPIESIRGRINESLGGISEPTLAPSERAAIPNIRVSPTPALKAPSERPVPETVTPPPPPEPSPRIVEPAAPGVPTSIGVEEIDPLFGKMGQGMAEGLYNSMFDRMRAGKYPDPFPPEQQTAFGRQALEAYKRGEIKSPEDLKVMARALTAPEAAPGPVETPRGPLENPYKVLKDLGTSPYEVRREGVESTFFTNRRAAEKFARSEWKNEQAPPEARKVNETLQEAVSSPSRTSPSTKSPEEKLQAVEASNAFAHNPDIIKRIQDSIESGVDISRDIYQAIPGDVTANLAVLKYKQAFDLARKGINSSRERGITELVNDVKELLAFDDTGTLSHRQKIAAQRLESDAKKSGTSLQDAVSTSNMDLRMKGAVSKYITEEMPQVNPPSGAGPRSMPLDGASLSGKDPVVERHTGDNGLLQPPKYMNELKGIQSANIREAPSAISVETPIRTARKFGQAIADMMFLPYRQLRTDITAEVKGMRENLRKVEKEISYSDRRNITKVVEEGNPTSLKGTQKQVYNTLENRVDQYFQRANQVRSAMGIDPFPEVVDPVGAMRAIEAARSHGEHINLATSPADQINLVLSGYTETPMKPTFLQKSFRMSSELDILRQYDKFATSAVEQLNIAPLTHKLRELVNGSSMDVAKMDGSKYNLGEENPGLKQFITQWADFVDGKPVFSTKWDPLLRKLNENMAWSMLSWGLRSVLAQPSSLINTMHQTGIVNTMGAIGDSLGAIFGGKGRSEAIESSKVLSSRSNPELFGTISAGRNPIGVAKELARAVREGRGRDLVGDIASIGINPLEYADFESAVITWNAYARQGRKMGLKGDNLINFADDGVVTSQASGARGDIAPIQRSALGKTITQFQTFTINDWNFMLNDVLKVKQDASWSDISKSVGKYIGIVTVYNTISHIFGMDPPTPQPLKAAMQTTERGGNIFSAAFNAGLELTSQVPVLGGARYGKGIGGPIPGLLTDIYQAAAGRPGAQNILEPLSKASGVPGIATWWRAGRGDPNSTVLQRLLTYNPDTQSGSSTLGSGLGSGMKSGMGSGLK